MANYKQNVSTLIVIVNWRSPWDSLECLESLLQQKRNDWVAVVVDNASGDESLDIFKKWASGALCGLKQLAGFSSDSQSLKYAPNRPNVKFLSSQELGAGMSVCERQEVLGNTVFFVANDKNEGFAAGNNVGLSLGRQIEGVKWIWLLNNDTVVDRYALDWLVAKSESAGRPCIVGATLMEYYESSSVQYNAGARYNKFLASVNPLKRPIPSEDAHLYSFERKVESELSYIVGASMFMSMEAFSILGFMREDYFLYYEELDWIAGVEHELDLLYAARAIVYHKEGGATGGKTNKTRKGFTSEYYSARSRILYTMRHKKRALISIVPLQFAAIIKRLVRDREVKNAKIVLKAMLDAFCIYCGKKSGGHL